jgi:hypothetical protein
MLKANIEHTKAGALIQRSHCPSMDHFIGFTNANGALERIYNDGLTACYVNRGDNHLYSYCEGDLVIIDCPSARALRREINAHEQHFLTQ